MAVVVRFRQPSSKPSRLISSSMLHGGGSLPTETQVRVRSMIDRYQVLALRNPKRAKWLIDTVDLMLHYFEA